MREDGAPIEVRFRQTPTVAGGVELFVRVRPPAGVRELSEDDNERRKTVNVIDRKMHVLVVASGPMRDYRFLHTMLNRHSSIDVDIWLQTVSPSTVGTGEPGVKASVGRVSRRRPPSCSITTSLWRSILIGRGFRVEGRKFLHELGQRTWRRTDPGRRRHLYAATGRDDR